MKNRVLYVFGTLFFALNQWIQIIMITQMIGVYEVGLYSYFLAIIAPLVLFSRYSFSVLIPTQQKYNYGYAIFYKYRNIFNLLFLFLSTLLSLFINLNLYETLCLITFILFKFYENKEEFIYAENIAESNIKFLAYSKIYKSIFTIITFSIVAVLTSSLLLSIFSLFIVQIFVYYIYDRKYLLHSNVKTGEFSTSTFKNIFILGLGLTIVSILTSLNANIPRYFIEHFDGREELGIYATMIYFATITNNVVMAINQSVIAKLSNIVRVNIKLFYKSFIKILIAYIPVLLLGFIILIIFGENFLTIVYGSHYEGYEFQLFLLGIQIILMVVHKVLEMGLSVINLYKILSVIQGATFIVTLIFSYILIIPFGFTGAFFVSILTYLLSVVGQGISLFVYRMKSKK